MSTSCTRAGNWGEYWKPEPAFADVDSAAEMLYDLSVFGFTRLSENDQIEKIEEIQKKIGQCVIIEQLPGESENDLRIRMFTEVFKKLQFPNQNLFLSRVMKKFRRKRQFDELIYWFKQLDANDQQEELGNLVLVTEEETTNDDFRMARFTQIARDYTNYVYHKMYPIEMPDDNDETPDWLSCFCIFFQGFWIIWFKGQCPSNQILLIEKLSMGEIGRTDKVNELGEDSRLKIFLELTKCVISFRIQGFIIDNAEEELRHCTCLPYRLLLKPENHASDSELAMQLSTFASSLVSTNDQHGGFCDDKFGFYTHLTKKFLDERNWCESILFFREVGSNEQEEIIEILSERYWECSKKALNDVMIRRFFEESEDEFRLRRFIKLCSVNPSLQDLFILSGAEKWDIEGMLQHTSPDQELEIALLIKTHSRYAEFLVGVSTIWFKSRFANDPRHAIQLQLSDDIAEQQHPNESNECFRLRRFTQSVRKFPSISQEHLNRYINHTIRPPAAKVSHRFIRPAAFREASSSFNLEFIKVKAPKLGGGPVATAAAIRGTTTQGGATATTPNP